MMSLQKKSKMAAAQFTLSDIPEELVIHILTFLPVKDVLKVGCTCKNLYKVTNQNIVWKCRFKFDNDHLRLLPRNSSDFVNPKNINSEDGLWKKLFFKSSHALSFGKRDGSVAGKRLCAEFVSTTGTRNGIRFDSEAPKSLSVELWVRVNPLKRDGVIIGCQSESVSSHRWPHYHWQILHVGPDGCIRGSLEPYKFMKGPYINDQRWHHIAITANPSEQHLLVDGELVCMTGFGVGHEHHRHFMKHSQLGSGVISHGANTPYDDDAMPKGYCGWYPFHGWVREIRVWSGMLSDSMVQQNMFVERIDLLHQVSSSQHGCSLIGYWPMNRLVVGPWPWQVSMKPCASHFEKHKEDIAAVKIVYVEFPS